MTSSSGFCRFPLLPLLGFFVNAFAGRRLAKPLSGGIAWRETEVERRVSGTDIEPELGGGQVVGQLVVGARADDQRRHRGPSEEPGERDLKHSGAMPSGDTVQNRVLDCACRQREPGDEGDALALAVAGHLGLVLRLEGRLPRQVQVPAAAVVAHVHDALLREALAHLGTDELREALEHGRDQSS